MATHSLLQNILEFMGVGGLLEHSLGTGALGTSHESPSQLSGHWQRFGARQIPLFWHGGLQMAEG